MPPQRIFPQQFMHLSQEMRTYFTQMWKIPRSGISEIRDQTVISDGHTYEDLAVITHELLNEYIGSEETFARAWEIACMKAYSELHPPVGVIKSRDEIEKEKSELKPGNETVSGNVLTKENLDDMNTSKPLLGADGKPMGYGKSALPLM